MDVLKVIPASCETGEVIRFLHEGHISAEIGRRLFRVGGDHMISDSSGRDWCRKFRNGCTDVNSME